MDPFIAGYSYAIISFYLIRKAGQARQIVDKSERNEDPAL